MLKNNSKVGRCAASRAKSRLNVCGESTKQPNEVLYFHFDTTSVQIQLKCQIKSAK